jgi:hypothetical protein
MGTVSRGFKGRGRRTEPGSSCPPASSWSRTSRSCRPGRPQHPAGGLGVHITNPTGDQQRWDWAGFRACPASQPPSISTVSPAGPSWSPSCSCGRAPSGSAASAWWTRTSRLLGGPGLPQLRRPLAGTAVLGRLRMGGSHDQLAANRSRPSLDERWPPSMSKGRARDRPVGHQVDGRVLRSDT